MQAYQAADFDENRFRRLFPFSEVSDRLLRPTNFGVEANNVPPSKAVTCVHGAMTPHPKEEEAHTDLLCLRSSSCMRLCRLSVRTRASWRSEVTRRQWRFRSVALLRDCSSWAWSAATFAHTDTHSHTRSIIILRYLICERRCRARRRVLTHLGIELLPGLSLRLQFFLRLLQSSADKLHLRLAAVQLHGQLTFCGGGWTLSGDGQGHFKSGDIFLSLGYKSFIVTKLCTAHPEDANKQRNRSSLSP